MKKLSILAVSLGFIAAFFFQQSYIVHAAFNPNRIIDDAIFDNSSTMNSAQIDAFLNGFSSSCISSNNGFEARNPNGYNPSTGFSYGGFVSAGQVISTAAQVYGLNPQVLIVTLEKEQSLVTGQNNFAGYCNNGDEHKYAAAVGYGCPDSGGYYNWSGVSLYRRNGVEKTSTGQTCVNASQKAGFSQQVIRAAWLLKFGQQRSLGNVNWAIITGSWDNSDDPQSCYSGPMTEGFRQVCPSGATTYYDGLKSIDGQTVHIDTGATAALYWYTPHFHGNENFVALFELWFGSVFANMSSSNIAWNFESLDGNSESISQEIGSYGKFTHTTSYNGDLHVFYYDQTGGNLRHAWADSNGWHFETLDGVSNSVNGQINANVGGFSKSTIFNNKLYLAYYDFTNQSLRLAVLDGSSWNFQTLDGDGGVDGQIDAIVGQDIAIGTNNNSVQLFYSDVSNGNLRHAWLTTSTWKFEDLDGNTSSVSGYSSFVGQGPSMTTMGTIIQLFYYDQTTGNLRHAWADSKGWHFENLDGDPLSVGKYNSNVGGFSTSSYFAGVLQLFYYDNTGGNLRHAWADSKGWHFENLDGDPLSVGKYNSNVGQRPFIIGDYSKNKLHVYYYDVTSKALLQAWADNQGWHFAVIDGSYTAVSRYQTSLDSGASGIMYGNSLQMFYQDLKNNSLRHAWGASN